MLNDTTLDSRNRFDHFSATMFHVKDSKGISPEWAAFSDDKLEWKQSGNYFTGEELRAMEEAARRELVLEFCPEPLLRAD